MPRRKQFVNYRRHDRVIVFVRGDSLVADAIFVTTHVIPVFAIERNLDPDHLIGPLKGVVVKSPGEIGASPRFERNDDSDDGEMTGETQFLRQRRLGLEAEGRVSRVAVDPIFRFEKIRGRSV